MTPNLPSPVSAATSPDVDHEDLVDQIRMHGDVPRHIAIIMDGNGRWARNRHLPRPLGHKAGMQAVRNVVEAARRVNVQVLTLFAFSQENWARPADEIAALMLLLEEYIARETQELRESGVEVHVLGDLDLLGPRARTAVTRMTEATAGGTVLQLNLCISYGSRAELARAARLVAQEVRDGRMDPNEITEDDIAQRLYTAPWGDPDLLIRTSGEQRLSNFLLWQLAYTELLVTPVLWPDFKHLDLYDAVLEYQRRERRFGRVSV